jgi:hypothetical protein
MPAKAAEGSEVPRGAANILRVAGLHGWTVETLVASGDEGELFVLRMRRNGHLIAATWLDGHFDTALPQWPRVEFNTKELREVLAIPPDDFEYPPYPPRIEDDVRENMRWEREFLGYYLSRHPLEFVNMRAFPNVVDADKFEEYVGPGQRAEVLGLAEEVDAKISRRGNPWVRFIITDLTGLVRCMAFGKTVKQLANGALIHAKGKVEVRDEEQTLIVTRVEEVSW